MADAAGATASAAGAAASAIGAGLAAAARAIGDFVVAVGSALVAAAKAVGHGIAVAANAVGAGFLAAFSFIGGVAVATATAIAAGASALLSAVIALAGLARDHPRETAGVAASAGGATGLAGLWAAARRFGWLSALPLYSRLKRSDLLDNKARAAVYAAIQNEPGVHPSALAERLGLGWGTVVYHLARLEEAGFVSTRKVGNAKCCFVVGGSHSPTQQKALAALKHDTAADVARFIAGHPGTSQKAVATGLSLSAALVSWHVKRLAASDVLRVERAGKATKLFVADGAPVTAPAPTPASGPAPAAA